MKRAHHAHPGRAQAAAVAGFTCLMLVATSLPLYAASVDARFFVLEPNKRFHDGDAVTTSSRTRAVVDSGLVQVPLFNRGDWAYQAQASADLSSGTLRTFAFSDTTDFKLPEAAPSLLGGYESQPSASFTDVVTFSAPAGAPPGGAPVPVTLKLDVSGRFAGSFSNMSNKTSLQVFAPGSLQKSQVEFTWSGRDGASGSEQASATTLGTVTQLRFSEPGQLHALLAVTIMAGPGQAISISAGMGAIADAGSLASALVGFDHTARLSIAAPAGYTFTSASGALLTQPVPVPTSVWLLGSALLGLKRRRRRVLPPAVALLGSVVCAANAQARSCGAWLSARSLHGRSRR